ncbi:hypothetical protein ACFL2Q_13110 [Thermodesulfobacteriota bacterium]
MNLTSCRDVYATVAVFLVSAVMVCSVPGNANGQGSKAYAVIKIYNETSKTISYSIVDFGTNTDIKNDLRPKHFSTHKTGWRHYRDNNREYSGTGIDCRTRIWYRAKGRKRFEDMMLKPQKCLGNKDDCGARYVFESNKEGDITLLRD